MPTKRSLKVDFHVHSHFSADGDMSPLEIIKAAKSAGLDAVAVTDHNSVKGGFETEKIAGGMLVFVGSEIKTGSGEIIGLNLKKDVPPGLSLLRTCKLVKEQGGFIIIPHPFDRFREGVGNEMKKIIGYIDAVEVFNARTLVSRFNRQALEFAAKHKLAATCGSDAHFTAEIGSAYAIVEAGRTKQGILEAIKRGRIETAGSKTGIGPHWKTFVAKIGRKI